MSQLELPFALPLLATPLRPDPRSFVAEGITYRQIECLDWVQQGKSAADIGGILGISGRTVDGHIIKICAALGVRTRMQAVLKARELGLFDVIRREFSASGV